LVTYGYVKDTRYENDGTLMIKVRIPNIHGPNSQKEYKGKVVRNYTFDADLPFYPALQMSPLPVTDEVVALLSTNDSNSNFLVIGSTGGHYITNIGGPG